MGLRELWNSVDGLAGLIEKANWGIAFTLLAAFACTVVVIKAGHRKDGLAAIDEQEKNNKIAETSERAGKLEKGNLELRGQIATLETNAATQQTRAANAERALLELQQRLSHRRISKSDHDKFVASLRPYRGSVVQLTKLGDAEAAQFAEDLLAALHDAGWSVQLSIVGTFSPPKYGILCTVDASTPAGKSLEAALHTLPTADVKLGTVPPGVVGIVFIGLKPPA